MCSMVWYFQLNYCLNGIEVDDVSMSINTKHLVWKYHVIKTCLGDFMKLEKYSQLCIIGCLFRWFWSPKYCNCCKQLFHHVYYWLLETKIIISKLHKMNPYFYVMKKKRMSSITNEYAPIFLLTRNTRIQRLYLHLK